MFKSIKTEKQGCVSPKWCVKSRPISPLCRTAASGYWEPGGKVWKRRFNSHILNSMIDIFIICCAELIYALIMSTELEQSYNIQSSITVPSLAKPWRPAQSLFYCPNNKHIVVFIYFMEIISSLYQLEQNESDCNSLHSVRSYYLHKLDVTTPMC